MDIWIKKFKVLTFALIFSGALNIGLGAALIVVSLKDSTTALSFGLHKTAPEARLSNLSILKEMAKCSFRELLTLLTNREMIEEGYTKRDLALSALVAYHHFHLEKALGMMPTKRKIENESIELYPDLSEEQFSAIIRFAYQEKWPLNSQGLFSLLHKLPREKSLEQAFALTPEFYALSLLFQKSGAPQQMQSLIQLASEGTWELLDQFAKEQAQLLDLSVEKRRRLLLSFLAHRSKTAANLLIKTDSSFAMKRLDDKGLIDLLSLLDEKTEEVDSFCAHLLQSARSDEVLKVVAEKARGWGAAIAVVPVEQPKVEEPIVDTKYHTVGEGESLWRISKTYKVSVDEIVQLNGIEKDKIYPGMTLKIPH